MCAAYRRLRERLCESLCRAPNRQHKCPETQTPKILQSLNQQTVCSVITEHTYKSNQLISRMIAQFNELCKHIPDGGCEAADAEAIAFAPTFAAVREPI